MQKYSCLLPIAFGSCTPRHQLRFIDSVGMPPVKQRYKSLFGMVFLTDGLKKRGKGTRWLFRWSWTSV